MQKIPLYAGLFWMSFCHPLILIKMFVFLHLKIATCILPRNRQIFIKFLTLVVVNILMHLHSSRIKLYNKLAAFQLCNSYTMGCRPVRGDNPQALASGLS